MRRDNSTRTPHVSHQPETQFDEPIRRWSNLPITQERAVELVDLLTRYEDSYIKDALIELVCGLMPAPLSDDAQALDERSLVGFAALTHAFSLTRRAGNELGAYAVNLKCGRWE